MFFLFLILFSSSFISLSCLVIQFFQSFVFVQLFSFIHLEYRSVVISFSFPFYLFLFCVFHFSKLLFCLFIFLYSILLKHAAILKERFGQTCMTKEQSEMPMLINITFARPLLHWAVPCTYRP